MRMPKEIVEAIRQMWIDYVTPINPSGLPITDEDIIDLEEHTLRGSIAYHNLFSSSDSIYGDTPDKRECFWVNVIMGQYELFFSLTGETIEIEGQKYVI